jgi:hypothetical protein
MTRSVTALVAALIFTIPLGRARDATAEGPFEDVPIVAPPPRSLTLSYLTAAAGVGSIAASFVFAGRGNAAYDDYLVESDPAEIERLWDQTILNDRLSSGLLLGGEVLVASAIYLAFLRDVPSSDAAPLSAAAAKPRAPLALSVGPGRCALAWRF